MATDSYPYPLNVGQLQTIADEVGTYPVRALLASGYIPDPSHEFADDVTGELSGGSYARVDLSSVTWTVVDDLAQFEADDASFASMTATDVDCMVVFADRGADSASPLIAAIVLPPFDVTAEPVTVRFTGGVVVQVTEFEGTGTGTVVSIVAGTNVTVDDTDPENPIVSATAAAGGPWQEAAAIDLTADAGPAVDVDLTGLADDEATVLVSLASTVTSVDVLMPASERGRVSVFLQAGGSAVFDVSVDGQPWGTSTPGLWTDTLARFDAGGSDLWVPMGFVGYALAGLLDTTGQTTGHVLTVPATPGDPAAWEAVSSGSGDVVGPASAVDDRIATFDGTTGKLIQDGGKTIAQLGTGSGVFGSGTDGALVLDGSSAVTGFTRSGSVYTPTRDIMATDLTVNSGVTLDLRQSWRLYATGTFSNAGTVRASGQNGGSPGTAGTANNWGSLGRGGSAGAGATGAGAASVSWDNTGRSKLQGNGGNGGLGASGAGGVAAVQAAADHGYGAVWGFHTVPGCISGYTIGNSFGGGHFVQLYGGGGGAGGGGDGTNTGGGGGSGANPILIVARYFNNTGTVTAAGGVGGNAVAGNAGGGGGGGGGAIIISSVTYTNSGTITVAGGAGGTKTGTGVDGVAGSAGTIVLVAL